MSGAELPVEDRLVRLRDVTLGDADALDRWNAARDGGFNDFGPRDPTSREALAHGPLRNERNATLIVETLDGTPVGTIGWHTVGYGPGPQSLACNIGIDLIPEGRGHGYGTEAQRLLADYLFATLPINRVEASTDVENLPEQRSLEKAGFRREGVTRGAQFRGGAFHDLIVYARIRSDP